MHVSVLMHSRFAFYQLLSFKPDNENNANLDTLSSKSANFDEVQFFETYI